MLDFDVSYYLNWTYDHSIYGIETYYIQKRYNDLFNTAKQFRDHIYSIVEIGYGYGYMIPLLNSALGDIEYLGFDSDEFKQNVVQEIINQQNTIRACFGSLGAVGYSRISLWKPNTHLPIGPVDMVIIHGQQHLKLASKIGRWVWVLDVLDTKGLKIHDEIWSNNG